jgi:hypothetical protein
MIHVPQNYEGGGIYAKLSENSFWSMICLSNSVLILPYEKERERKAIGRRKKA